MAYQQEGVTFFEGGEYEASGFRDFVDIDLFDDAQVDEETNLKVRLTLTRSEAALLGQRLLDLSKED